MAFSNDKMNRFCYCNIEYDRKHLKKKMKKKIQLNLYEQILETFDMYYIIKKEIKKK